MTLLLRLAAIAGVIALAGGLYALRAPAGPDPVAAATAAPPASPPVAAAPAASRAGDAGGPASGATTALPADERATTRDARLEALPMVLQTADAAIARVRGELTALTARGAPAAERQALEAQLQRMLSARAQLLARNADVSPVR